MSVQVGTWTAVARPLRYAAIATLAIVLFGGWSYLYVKARAVDLTAATDVLASLRELREIDGRWKDWLIGTRAAGGDAAQRSSVDPTKLDRIHALLALKVFALDNLLPPATLAGLKDAFDAKMQAVEAFGAASTAYTQALAEQKRTYEAFASAARERASGIPPAAARDAERAYEAALRFAAQPSTANAKGAEGALADLAAVGIPELARPDVE